MRAAQAAWKTLVDQQHRYPTGLIGRLIGERMLRQHAPETDWSLDLLDLQPADRVLEIGFGAGRGLARAAAQTRRGHIAGVDLSPTMLRAAARRNRRAIRRGQLLLVRGDLASLPFGEQRLDKLVSIHTFYFWHEHRAVCRQLIGLLAPGGRLISTFATARRQPDGAWQRWPVHDIAEALVHQVQEAPGITARLLDGPVSRGYNSVALVVDRAEAGCTR